MVAIALYLVSFYVFVSIFSDGAESQARWKILAIALAATGLLQGISAAIPTLVGLGIGCLAAALVSFVSLILWVKVTKVQAVKITGAYVGFVVAYSVVVALIFAVFGSRSG